FARLEPVRVVVSNKKHLASGAQSAAEFGDKGRFAEHSAAGRNADHVAIAVNGGQMGGALVSASARHLGRARRPWERRRSYRGTRARRITRVGEAWTGQRVDQFDTLGSVRLGEQTGNGHGGKIGVTVVALAVGEGEF